MTGLTLTPVGTQPPRFVFLHGLFGRGRNWTRIAQGLLPHGGSVLVDLPNHGTSPWTEQISFPGMAQAVNAEVETLDAPVVLVGHSLGGKVAMWAALSRPELYAGLAVVDISPTDSGQVSAFGPYIAAMQAIDLTTLQSKAEADQLLTAAVPSLAVRQFLLTNLRDRGGWHWQPNLELLAASLPELAGWPDAGDRQFVGPTSWIVGGRSHYFRPGDLDTMQRHFPAVGQVVVPDAGHWVHADQPEAVIAALAALSAASPR
ncbi:MAG: alpha/beta hydrolase [Actinobacteria bacterium HGW-Actinobacteria-2]|nr:MAG: alpha/beta hydrolase [Actinobacteria bacterium HGW-Actinobacteria-2]